MKKFFEKNRKRMWTSVGVALVLVIFSLVAFHNLGKFETSDEDLWKEGRIQQYWVGMKNGLANGNWQDTYVNDKPGVTVSMLAGPMLTQTPDPQTQIILEKQGGKYLFERHLANNTEDINRMLRLPIVLFCVLSLAVSGFLVFRWSGSIWVTLFAMVLIALNPVLLGMSQILNPDAILWSSAFVSLLAFLLVLKTAQWRYAVFSGIFFGLAIASKYTGNLLTLFFLGLIFAEFLFGKNRSLAKKRYILIQFLGTTAIGYGVFALLVPYVFFRGELFLAGTFLSRGIGEVVFLLAGGIIVLVLDVFCFRARGIDFLRRVLVYVKPWALRLVAGALLLVFLGHILNAWTGGQFVPLNDLRETVEYQTGQKGSAKITLVFPMISESDGIFVSGIKKILVQSAYVFFTAPFVVILILVAGMILVIVRGRVGCFSYVLFALAVPWVFFVGGLISNVLVNVRYGILLQPIFGLLSAIFLWEFLKIFSPKRLVIVISSVALGGLIVAQSLALASISPHFLNYQSVLLPKSLSFADSWSYGQYEAAQWLNTRPNAESLEVWTDRKALCDFFVGKCIRDSAIDLGRVSPDYFVVTRRNVVKGNWFTWRNPELARYDSSYYYSEEVLARPEWELHIGGRPLNYVKIIQSREEDARHKEGDLGENVPSSEFMQEVWKE